MDLIELCQAELLFMDGVRERPMDITDAGLVGVIEETVVTVPVIFPARMIEDWVQADSVNRHSHINCCQNLIAY